jgi:hypothetical protein
MYTEFDRKPLFYKFTIWKNEKMDIRELDSEDGNWIELAQDRF